MHAVLVRWEDLFDDLEAEIAAGARAELTDRAAELARADAAGVGLVERLRGRVGGPVRLTLADGSTVAGRVVDVAERWSALADGARQHLVPHAAVAWVEGATGPAGPAATGVVERRLGLAHALRAISRDRSRVQVRTAAGTLAGVVVRVGRDYVDLDTGARPGTGPVLSVLLDRLLCVSTVP